MQGSTGFVLRDWDFCGRGGTEISGKDFAGDCRCRARAEPVIAQSQADFAAAKRTASLALVLKHTEDLLAAISRQTSETSDALLAKETDASMATKVASAAAGPPPVLLPPFTPGGTPPGEIRTADTTPVTVRNYSLP